MTPCGRLTVVVLLILGFIPSLALTGELPHSLISPVLKIVDGDTIDVQFDGGVVRVRYIGINTPEMKHSEKGVEPFGPEADEANRGLVEGQTVRLELDVQPWDWYQRLLAYVYVGATMINAELVRQGDVQVAMVPPNMRYAESFRQLKHEALEAGRGLCGQETAGGRGSFRKSPIYLCCVRRVAHLPCPEEQISNIKH